MFARILVLIIAFSVFTGELQATTGTSLKQAFDEFNYTVTVEWDQKDRTVYDQAVAKLKAKFAAAQAEGYNNGELLDAIAEQSSNVALKKELQALRVQAELGLISKSEIEKRVQDAVSRSYARGASWNGEAVLLGVVGLIVVLILVGYVQCVADPNHTTVCSDYGYCSSFDDYCEGGVSCGCSH